MSDALRTISIDDLLRDLAADEARRPVRITPAMLRLKADLARADHRRARAARVERWAFGAAGLLLVCVSLAGLGPFAIGAGAAAAPGWLALAAAGWSLARAVQA